MDVRKSGRKNAAADGQDFAAHADGLGKIAGNVSEGRQKKIAEVVAHQTAAGVEAVLKEATEKGFVFRKSDHAVANVAGGEDAIFAAQAAGAAAVIRDGHNGGEVGDGMLGRGVLIGAADYMFLEAAKEGGKTSAAAEGD